MWRILLGSMLGLLPLGVVALWKSLPDAKQSEVNLGREEAARDIRDGKLILRYWSGLGERCGATGPTALISPTLQERLGVRYEVGGYGCVVDERATRIRGFNEVMLAEIDRRAKLLPPAEKK